MTLFQLIPTLAAVAFLVGNTSLALRDGRAPKGIWRVAAGLSVLFLAFSVFTVMQEGPVGFWPVHTHNFWGNQVWCDLLLSASVAFGLMAPEARARGMSPLPWFLFIAATGSVGVLAMLARVLYLREHRAEADVSTPAMARAR